MKPRTKLNVAVIGCGEFARSFVPLFQMHPDVACVRVCDRIPERASAYADRFGVDIIPSFEDALSDPTVNAVALFTQRHLHGPMAVRAILAGKHVYSAVPMASTPDECKAIIDAVNASHKST